jgi:hypothetical protein
VVTPVSVLPPAVVPVGREPVSGVVVGVAVAEVEATAVFMALPRAQAAKAKDAAMIAASTAKRKSKGRQSLVRRKGTQPGRVWEDRDPAGTPGGITARDEVVTGIASDRKWVPYAPYLHVQYRRKYHEMCRFRRRKVGHGAPHAG